MKRRKVLMASGNFTLVEQIRPHKTWYELIFVGSRFNYNAWTEMKKEIVSTLGKPKGPYAIWSFWTRAEAEKQYTYALLKWQ